MKKVLLTGAALVAMASTPAMAEGLKLDLAGYFKGYGVYNNNGGDARDVSFRKDTEVHFTGETTLDSGLTVGVHVEADVDGADNFDVDESYMYMSGGWGRVNFGEEDGAAYLLQVAAPSADSNVDGLRQYISASQFDTAVDYSLDPALYANKVTYMTPVFSGFQVGASYAPSESESTTSGVATTTAVTDEAYELAARYEGAFEGVGVALGAGYAEVDGTEEGWNVGADLDFAGFGLGAAYVAEEDTTVDALGTTYAANEVDTIVLGADYQMGAYKLGGSWMNKDVDTAATDFDLDRYTGGVSYSYGPGMSFRGSISYLDSNDLNFDETQVLVGTQVNF